MYFEITADNEMDLVVWSSSAAGVARYVNWLNRDRDVDLFFATTVLESEWPEHRDDVANMDEPGWDDFMSVDYPVTLDGLARDITLSDGTSATHPEAAVLGDCVAQREAGIKQIIGRVRGMNAT